MNIWLLHPWQTTLQFWYSKFCTRLQLPEDESKFWIFGILTVIHLNARELVLLKDLDKKRVGQVWHCVVSTATATVLLIRAWSIMKGDGLGHFQHLRGYFRVSLRRFGQNGRMMRRLPMLRFFKWSSCGRNTTERCWSPALLLWEATSSLLRLPYLFITSSIVTCRFSRRSCRLLTCKPSLITKANMVSPTTIKVNTTVTHYPQPPNSKR